MLEAVFGLQTGKLSVTPYSIEESDDTFTHIRRPQHAFHVGVVELYLQRR